MAFRSGSRGVEVLSGSAIAGRFVDGLVLDLAAERKFRRGELYETREGLCRVGPPIAKELAGFGPVCEPRLSLMRSGSRKRSLGRGRRAAKRQVGGGRESLRARCYRPRRRVIGGNSGGRRRSGGFAVQRACAVVG